MIRKPISFQAKQTWTLWAVFLLALVLRLGYQHFLKTNYLFYDSPSSDVTYYQDWARDIAAGNWIGQKTFFGLPLYPYFLAVLFRLSLGHTEIVRLFHMMIGSLNCVLIFLIGQKLFSYRTGLTAAILASFNFILIYYDWIMMPVPLLIMLSLLLLWCLLSDALKDRPKDWFLFGILLGLSALGDGKFLFFLLLLILMILFKWPYHIRIKLFKIILPLGLGCALMLLTVSYRNKVVGGDWTFISAQSGLSFYTGNNRVATGVYDHPAFLRPSHQGQDDDQKIIAEKIAKKQLSPSAVSRFWRAKALKFIAEEPGLYLKLLLRKFCLFFTDTEDAHDADLLMQRDWRKKMDINPYWLICPLGIGGLLLSRKKTSYSVYLNFILASQLLMTLVFFLSTRHRATIIPVFLLYEAFALLWIWDNIRKPSYRRLGLAAVFLLIFLCVFPPEESDSSYTDFVKWSKSGTVFLNRGDTPAAQNYFYKALALRPNDSTTLYNLGNAFVQAKNFAKAQEYYLRAVNICPHNVDALFNLAYTYEQTGQFESALKYYQQVKQYQPESLDVWFRLSQVYYQTGDCQKAVLYYQNIIERQPALSETLRSCLKSCF